MKWYKQGFVPLWSACAVWLIYALKANSLASIVVALAFFGAGLVYFMAWRERVWEERRKARMPENK